MQQRQVGGDYFGLVGLGQMEFRQLLSDTPQGWKTTGRLVYSLLGQRATKKESTWLVEAKLFCCLSNLLFLWSVPCNIKMRINATVVNSCGDVLSVTVLLSGSNYND